MRKIIILGLFLFIALSLFLSKPKPALAATCWYECNLNQGYSCSELGCSWYTGCYGGICYTSPTCLDSYPCGRGTTTTACTLSCSYYGRSCGTWSACGGTNNLNCGTCQPADEYQCSYSGSTAGTCICSANDTFCPGRCSTTQIGCWVSWYEPNSQCNRSGCYGGEVYNCPDPRCDTTTTTTTATTTTTTQPPSTTTTTVNHYSCNTGTGNCYSDSNGSYTNQTTCNNACDIHYSCNTGTGNCVVDSNGSYTNQTTCNNNCDITSTTYYECNNGTGNCSAVSYDTGYTNQTTCNNACDIHYSCNTSTGNCSVNASGSYTNQTSCNNACDIASTPTPTPTRTPTPTPTGIPTPTPTGIPNYTVSGYVYIDSDRDGVKEAGEGGFQGAIIIYQKAGGNPTNNPPTGATGLYIFTATAGSWTVTLNVPNGYESSDGITQRTLNVASNLSDINFGIIAAATPTPTTVSYNASGFVFYDYNSNQTFNKNATIPEKCLDIPVTINFCGVAHVFDPADSNWATDPSSGCKIYSYSCSSGNSCETVIIQSLPTGYFTTGWNGSDATRQNISGMTGASAYVCNE